MTEKPMDITRRTILTSIGAGGLATGLATVGSAKYSESQQFQSSIETAHQIRSSEGRSAYIKYLDNENMLRGHATSEYNLSPNEANSDGVSTQKLNDVDGADIDISMYLVAPTPNNMAFYAELEWRYRIGCLPYYSGAPESPLDSIGFAWSDSCWETSTYELDTSSASSDHVTAEDAAFGAGTFGFNVDDKAIGQETAYSGNCSTYTDYYWGGVYLDAEYHPDCYNDSDTKILGVYDHTWSGTRSSFGVSASFPASIGISYTTESYVDHESTTTEDDGDTALLVTRDDATVEYP